MIEVFLQRIGQLVFNQIGIVVVVADLDRAIGRKQLRTGIGLKPEHCLLKQRVPNLRHAIDRGTIRRALRAGDLNLEAEQLDAERPVLNPLLTALDVVLDTAQQLVADAVQFHLVNVLDKVLKPSTLTFGAVFLDRLAVEADRDRPVIVVDLEDRIVVADFRRV